MWRTLASGGHERHYLLSLPDLLAAGDAAPLILEFHGLTSNAAQQAEYSGLAAAGTARGFVVATAQGTGRVPHWNYPGIRGVDDVAFVDDLVDAIARDVPINDRRIFAAGISNGAGLVMSMVSRVRRPLAGVAAVAGGNIARAVSDAPVGVLLFHGTADGLIPYAGGRYFQGLGAVGRPGPVRRRIAQRRAERAGPDTGAGPRSARAGRAGRLINLPAVPVEQTAADWARVNGCTDGPTTTPLGDDVRRVAYGGCNGGVTVELYAVQGGGHVWPGARDVPVPLLGRTTHTISATAVMLERWSTAARPQ